MLISNSRIRIFRYNQTGIAALEFATAAPVMILMMVGGYELSRAIDSVRRITSATSATATMIATNTTGSVTYTDLHYAFDSMMLNFPGVLSDSYHKGVAWGSDISISMAGISFTPTVSGCSSGCTYKANVVWTGAAVQRACGSTITPIADANTPTATTLPSDLFTPVASPAGGYNPPPFAVVVDVTYSWTPLLFSRFVSGISIKRSAYVSPRYVSAITYAKVTGDDAFGKECPGY